MKRSIRLAIAVAILIAGIALFALLAGLKNTPLPANPPRPFSEVETVTARKQDLAVSVTAQGVVEPVTVTRAAAEVEGVVVAVSPRLEAGASFQEGEILLEIDPSDYLAELAQARSNLAEAKLALAEEEMRARQADRDWKRLGSPGQAPSDLALRLPHLEAARARAEAAEAAVARAEKNLERTKLRAPYEGRVRAKLTDLGSRVGKGEALAEFYALSPLEVRLPVSRQDAAFLEIQGQEIELKVPGEGDRTWRAILHRSEGEIRREDRTIVIVARLDGKMPGAPLPGQFVEASITGRVIPGVVRVPRRAFVTSDRVMVVAEAHSVSTREVEVLRTERDEVLVTAGIEDGEQLCVTALTAVIEGMEVKVVSRDGVPVAPADAP